MLVLQWQPGLDALRLDRAAVLRGEFWRVLSGHMVHLSFAHWAIDTTALFLISALLRRVLGAAAMIGVLCASALGVSFGLLALQPRLDWYAGSSGALHGLFAAGCAIAALRGHAPGRRWGAALWVAGLIKVAVTTAVSPLVLDDSWLALPAVPVAHLYGFLAGTLAGVAESARARRAQRQQQAR
jgi:rhomboid family GlyGly-CTERM serine protease